MDRLETVTIKRAAQLLGMTETGVRRLLAQGRVVGTKEQGPWTVSVASVQALLDEREAVAEERRRKEREHLDAIASTWRGSKTGPAQTC